MEKFNAGYKLIEELSFSNHHYVLGHMPTAPASYVTWESNESKDAFFRGHYFTDKESALVDLFRRVGKDLHLDSGKPLAIALLTEENRAAIESELREETAKESICSFLADVLDNEEEYAYDYHALLADPKFMSMALHLYYNIDHSYENEAFTDNLKDLLEEFPQHKLDNKKIPDFFQDPEPTQISPEEAQLLNDLLKHPSAEIPNLYGPFGDSFDFFFTLGNGFTASLEMFPTYDARNPNQLSETEPPHVQVLITNELDNIVFAKELTAKDLNNTLTGAHELKNDQGYTFLTLTIQEDESLRRMGKQFIFECSGGDEHFMKHNGEPCTVQRALTSKESDILINGLMWEVEFPDGDKLHIFDYELKQPVRSMTEKIPLSQQIDSAQEKTKPAPNELTALDPER